MKATLVRAKPTYLIDGQFHVRDDSRNDVAEFAGVWSHTLCGRLVQFERQSSALVWCEKCWEACMGDTLKSAKATESNVSKRKKHKHKKGKSDRWRGYFTKWPSDQWDKPKHKKPTTVETQRFEPPRLIPPTIAH